MDQPEPQFAVLKLIAETAVLSGSLAYLAGWSSLSSYYNSFGIGLFALDIPFTLGCLFAIRTILHSIWPAISIVFLLIVYGAAKSRVWNRLISAGLVAVATLSFALALAFSGESVGRAKAVADMREATSELPLIAFVLKERASYAAPDCLVANTMDCRMLVHSGGLYYFFEPMKARGALEDLASINVEVETVADKDLALVRVQRGMK